MRSDRERLYDILDAIDRIEAQAARGRDAFAGDEVAQTAVIRWVEIIGEAARGLTEELRAVVRRPRSGCGRLVWRG